MGGQVETTPGEIVKLAEITASSYVAGEEMVTYTFDIQPENRVPINGRIRFQLPDEAYMDVDTVQSNCMRLGSFRDDSLDCFANIDSLYFDVIVRSATFGADGL